MSLYTAVLVLHAIAVLVLTAALTMETWTLLQIRRVTYKGDGHPMIGVTQTVAIAAPCSLFIILVTGANLTESLRSWGFAWPRLAVVDVVLFGLFGGLSGRRMRAIERFSAGDNCVQSVWDELTHSAFLKLSLSIRIWIVLGAILLTAAKPGLGESLAVVSGALICGMLFSFVSFERRGVPLTACGVSLDSRA